MPEFPKYPGKYGNPQQHIAFSNAARQQRVESGKARNDFAVWLGDTALGRVYYLLSEEQKLVVDAGLASIYTGGFRHGHEVAEVGSPAPEPEFLEPSADQPELNGEYLLPPIFAVQPDAIRLQKEGE